MACEIRDFDYLQGAALFALEIVEWLTSPEHHFAGGMLDVVLAIAADAAAAGCVGELVHLLS